MCGLLGADTQSPWWRLQSGAGCIYTAWEDTGRQRTDANFCGCNSTKTTTRNLYFGCQAVWRWQNILLALLCWTLCLLRTHYFRERVSAKPGRGKKKKMELKTSLWLTASVVVFLLQNICVLLLSDLKQQHPPQLWLCCMTLIPAQRGSELHSLFWITSFCLPADSLGWPRSLHCCGCLGHFRSALLLFSTSKARRLVSEGGPPRLSVRTTFSKCFAFPYSVSSKRQKVTSHDTKI